MQRADYTLHSHLLDFKQRTAWHAMDSPRPMLSTPSFVLPLTLTAPASMPSAAGKIRAHRIEIRQQLRLLRDHRHIDVRHSIARFVHPRDRALQQRDAVGALPLADRYQETAARCRPRPAAPSTASVTA